MPAHDRKESYIRQEAYLNPHRRLLGMLKDMWEDPTVQLYNDDKMPIRHMELERGDSVFLAGPTSRNQILEYNWRCEAVTLLRSYGFRGWIFCPEPRGLELSGDFTERTYIHRWESDRLMNASHVAFWIPRKADELLGLNTNLELGIFLGIAIAKHRDGQKLFVGRPSNAERMGLPNHYAQIAGVEIHSELRDLCKAIADTPRRISKAS